MMSGFGSLANEASPSLVMSIEVEIYYNILIYAYVSTCYMDLRQNGKTNRQNGDGR